MYMLVHRIRGWTRCCLSTFLMGLQVDGPCTGVNDGIEERVSAYLQCDKFRPDLCRLFIEASVRARAHSTPPFIESRPFVSSLSNDFSERHLPDLSSGPFRACCYFHCTWYIWCWCFERVHESGVRLSADHIIH